MFGPSLRKKYNQTIQTLQAYQSAVNQAALVSITDLDGKIMYVNSKFTEISKYTAEELIGNTHSIINSSYHSDEFFRDMWQTISSGKHWRGEIKNRKKDGSCYWVDTVITPVLDQKGKIFQYLSVRNVITDKKQNEEKLISIQKEIMRGKQQLKDAQKISKTGSWHINLPGNVLELSEETHLIFEIPEETEITYEMYLGKVHPADRAMVIETWQAAFISHEFDIEYRIMTDKGIKWVRERASFEIENSIIVAALGTVQDITEKKKIEDSLRESETLYKNLFNNSPFAIGILEKKTQRFLEVNNTAMNLYGYTKEEFLKLTAYDIRVPAEHNVLEHQLSAGNYTTDTSIRKHKKKNGDIILIEPSISEIKYKGKQVYLITITDVTDKLRIEEELNLAKITRQKEIIEAQEKSRAEIGMELHDNINQLLTASRIYLKNIHGLAKKEQEFLQASLAIIGSANDEIRKLSASLVTPSLQSMSLKEYIELFSNSFELANVALETNVSINETNLGEGLKINIYRIIQEQCNNIIKYASATKVNINLVEKDNLLLLEITDNGIGFDQNSKKKGIGLNNIMYRAEAYNGKVNIISSTGKGCKVFVEFTAFTEHNE